MVNREQLQVIRTGYQQQHEQHVANANATLGAAQAIDAILQEHYRDAPVVAVPEEAIHKPSDSQ